MYRFLCKKIAWGIYIYYIRRNQFVPASPPSEYLKVDVRALLLPEKDDIIDPTSYLIKYCYFKLGEKLFRQDIGIPMGCDPAPAFADLFLQKQFH